MKTWLKLLTLLTSALIFTSCEERALQRDLVNYKSSLAYLHDTKLSTKAKTDSLVLDIKGPVFSDSTTVRALNKVIVPLLFFNYFQTNMQIGLGKVSMTENYSDFLYRSFDLEAERTASFAVTTDTGDSALVYEITFDSCRSSAFYVSRHMSMLLVIGVALSKQQVRPSVTQLFATGRLKRKGVILMEKKYAIREEELYLRWKTRDEEKFRQDMTSNLVESLSLATKKCIESMITDLDAFLQKK
jgi:hypothetical protein